MTNEYYGITIDTSLDSRFSEQALKLLKDYYLLPEEVSPQEAYARTALAFCAGDMALAQRIYDYVSKNWFMFSSPILSNAPAPGKTAKALPISCFLTYVPDTLEGLIAHQSELAWLSVKGGGVGGHWSDVRAVSDKAPGPIPFIKVADSAMTAYKQGRTRKGSYAAYLDVNHPDIIEFLNFRLPTGGDPNRKAFNLHNAINISDHFMAAVVAGADWSLVDPVDGTIRDTVNARDLWQRILEVRFRTGEPYLNFIDTVNESLQPAQKQKGMKVRGSNLCNEIHLVTDEQRTAVCCLSSVNLEHFDEWSQTRMVSDLIRFLDNVLQYFIDHCPKELERARYSAMMERSLGLGAMGFHSYLQKHNLPWESALAKSANLRMSRYIHTHALTSSQILAQERGEPEDMKGTGFRNAHLLAIAPNANSSIIAMCSPSIEPMKSNAFTHRTRVGTHLIKNRYLTQVLKNYGKDTEEIWTSIVLNDGSVQHLEFMSEWDKDVFKTAFELDQHWVVEHAATRQPYVCQGQSVNTFFPAKADRSYVNSVHLKAWKADLKGLYYLRSEGAKAEKVSNRIERVALSDLINNEDGCVACQG
jgi:ribonucleoside-diphosphate reductase alpha chain